MLNNALVGTGFVQPKALTLHLRTLCRSCARKMTRSRHGGCTVPVRRSKRLRTTAARHPSPSYSWTSSEDHDTDGADSEFDPTSEDMDPSNNREVELYRTTIPGKRRSFVMKTSAIRETNSDSFSDSLRQSTQHDTRTSFTAEELAVLRSKLLDWYVDNHRKLPWRPSPRYQKQGLPVHPLRIPDLQSSPGAPYAVWISEVMSQQTRIQVVVEYYTRWMREFPTVHDLAKASLDRVNELWAGLGYYRRARFLHEGAKQVVEKYKGSLPSDVQSLQNLKGIGRYTAGAISSIAFGRDEPVVDGNVERVLSRVLPALTKNPETLKRLPKHYWSIASSCVENVASPGDFNQAVMELGATVCKPKNVQCCKCPLQSVCGAYKEAKELNIEDPSAHVTRYPVKDPRKQTKVREESVVVLVVCGNIDGVQKFLTFQRPKDGLLANLWEAPNKVIQSSQPDEKEKGAALNELLEMLRDKVGIDKGIDHTQITEVNRVLHIFSHIRQTLHVKVLKLPTGVLKSAYIEKDTTKTLAPLRWLSRDDLEECALSTQMRKVFASATGRLDDLDST